MTNTSKSSPPEKLTRRKLEDICDDPKSRERARKELAALEGQPINMNDPDAPPLPADAVGIRGRKLFKPIKEPITIRLEAQIVEWFKQNHPKYQTAINDVLADYIFEKKREAYEAAHGPIDEL